MKGKKVQIFHIDYTGKIDENYLQEGRVIYGRQLPTWAKN